MADHGFPMPFADNHGFDLRPCLAMNAPHPGHNWTPLVVDPDSPQVLHLGLATLRCPGLPVDEWLAQRQAAEGSAP